MPEKMKNPMKNAPRWKATGKIYIKQAGGCGEFIQIRQNAPTHRQASNFEFNYPDESKMRENCTGVSFFSIINVGVIHSQFTKLGDFS